MFEEVKEMIDSTIYTNGRGEVTAQNINLAMHGVVEATEEGFAEVKGDVTALGKRVDEIAENGTGGGEVLTWQQTPAPSGPLTFYVGYFTTLSAEERITVEQKEHNAKMFEIYKSSPYALGVLADQSEMFTASMGMSGRAIKTSVPCQAQYFPVETGAESIMLKQKITDNSEIGVIIFPDGSVYRANELE